MVTAHFSGFTDEGEGGRGKEPLPDVFAGSIFVFLVKLSRQKDASITGREVLGMEEADFFHLRANFWQNTSWQRYGSVFLTFAVVDGEEHGIKIEAVDAKVDAFCQPQSAAVEEQDHEPVRWAKMMEDGINFAAGQHHGDVAMTLGANDAVDLAEVAAQDMAEEEEKSVKGLVLGGSRDSALHGEGGEESANLLITEVSGGPASDKSLKSTNPKAVDCQGLWGIIAKFDFGFQVTKLPLPGSFGRWGCGRLR